jgi:uncharacterized protein (DUF1684 family)
VLKVLLRIGEGRFRNAKRYVDLDMLQYLMHSPIPRFGIFHSISRAILKTLMFPLLRTNISLVFVFMLFNSCSNTPTVVDEKIWSTELEDWRENRIAELKMERGWLSLTGMDWLKDGSNSLGTEASNDIQFKDGSAASRVGIIHMVADTFLFVADPAAKVFHNEKAITEIMMEADYTGNQTILSTGSVQFGIIRRSGRFALRTWDKNATTLANFREIPIYKPEVTWVIPATFHRYDPPRNLVLTTLVGTSDDNPNDGYLEFNLMGKTYRFDVVASASDTTLFVVFGDPTNKDETYGGGRYMYIDRPDTNASKSQVIIDFNKAYNPPCAFTAYSTCAFPPEQNTLPIKVTAGEKRY